MKKYIIIIALMLFVVILTAETLYVGANEDLHEIRDAINYAIDQEYFDVTIIVESGEYLPFYIREEPFNSIKIIGTDVDNCIINNGENFFYESIDILGNTEDQEIVLKNLTIKNSSGSAISIGSLDNTILG